MTLSFVLSITFGLQDLVDLPQIYVRVQAHPLDSHEPNRPRGRDNVDDLFSASSTFCRGQPDFDSLPVIYPGFHLSRATFLMTSPGIISSVCSSAGR